MSMIIYMTLEKLRVLETKKQLKAYFFARNLMVLYWIEAACGPQGLMSRFERRLDRLEVEGNPGTQEADPKAYLGWILIDRV